MKQTSDFVETVREELTKVDFRVFKGSNRVITSVISVCVCNTHTHPLSVLRRSWLWLESHEGGRKEECCSYMLQKLIILRVIGRTFFKVLIDMKRSGAVFSASMLWLSHLVCDFINFCCAVRQKQPRSRLQIMAKKRGIVHNVCISWALLIAWCHFIRRKRFYGVTGNNKTYVGRSNKVLEIFARL
jgi:hypothetical protein